MRNPLLYLLTPVAVFAVASGSAIAKPDKVDGVNVPQGRIPQEIKDNRYPRTYFPGTEEPGPPTGWPDWNPTIRSWTRSLPAICIRTISVTLPRSG